MAKLIDKINRIPKSYFSLMDIRKIAGAEDSSLKVALSRLVKSKQIFKLGGGLYAPNTAKIDWEKLALEIYAPSYLSFEYALAKYNILSQRPHHLTLVTSQRAKTVITPRSNLIYHHLNPRLFWGYKKNSGALIAEPEKAFLDLAYLSLNGYARFDVEEMNIKLLNKALIKNYLSRFKSKKLNNLIGKTF